MINSDDVLIALRLWHGGDAPHWPMANLRLGLALAQDEDDYGTLAETGRAANNRAVLSFGLDQLRRASPEAEELLRERFEHRRDVLTVANRLNISESTLYYRQRQAISHLTDILNQQESLASSDWRNTMETRLSIPSYEALVGIGEAEELLKGALFLDDEHFIISIDGIGGLGKTALADYLARQIISTTRFDEIAWVTAKHTHLSMLGRLQIESGRPALTLPLLIERLCNQFGLDDNPNLTHLQRQRLLYRFIKERRCLIIIDNLETVADYQTLIPELKKWQNPSKFLLTSRIRLLSEPGIFSYSHKELNQQAALQLVRQEAKRGGFKDLTSAPDKEVIKIYKIVGGNPLALKLIIGQLRFYSLVDVLNRFAANRPTETNEGIFDYIFREIWESLDNESKTVLVSLTQAGESGFTLDHLVAVSELPETAVYNSLTGLVVSSLVDIAGTLLERRYRLHRLTEIFLLRMIEGE
ncbi:NB-ARC domain-containing protein [Candidatus Leptofilum sp.]|uniref:NB-ARC domain-containing protein n=1 Tax=Candidatus Leptofilum sp. TaxID=3241576 RepID=UPI003B5ABDC4